MTQTIVDCIAAKHAAVGTHEEERLTEICSKEILKTRFAYIQALKTKLRSMKQGSKLWWKKVYEILGGKSKECNIPALQDDTGSWIMDAQGKAKLISKTLSGKWELADRVLNAYSTLPIQIEEQDDVPLPTVEMFFHELSSLREDSGTGPDTLPAKILKYCAAQLAKPVAILAMRIIMMGVWPDAWREHWVIPLFKKGATFLAKNYRGIHLTAQLSKVVERLLKRLLEPYLERTIGYGPNQLAYRAKR